MLEVEPTCRECAATGRTTPAAQLDHVEAAASVIARLGQAAFYEPANLQPLCVACHARKSGRERTGR
jgi:5-methylcytosine-specific restriction protein A